MDTQGLETGSSYQDDTSSALLDIDKGWNRHIKDSLRQDFLMSMKATQSVAEEEPDDN